MDCPWLRQYYHTLSMMINTNLLFMAKINTSCTCISKKAILIFTNHIFSGILPARFKFKYYNYAVWREKEARNMEKENITEEENLTEEV